MSEIQHLHTNINPSNQENTRLGYKNNVSPECVNIFQDLSRNDGLSKHIHVKSINNNWNNSTYTKNTELSNHVNTVAKDYHDSYYQNTVINNSFQAEQSYHGKE